MAAADVLSFATGASRRAGTIPGSTAWMVSLPGGLWPNPVPQRLPALKKSFPQHAASRQPGLRAPVVSRHIKKTAQRLPLPSRATVSQGQCALPDGSHAGEQKRHEKTMPFTPCILIKTQLSYTNTTNRRDCLHRFDTPSFGDRRQGLPPRSPDRFHPSKKSALERGWGELEGGRGKPCARAKVSPFPPHHKQALRPASPDAR